MKIRNGVLLLVEATMLLLAGCATDRVIFVTKTSIGIDADTTPPTVSIAYDRTDGYFGPRYDSGAVPPVVSSIKSDLAVFSPKIRQVYATGNAATLVTTSSPEEPKPLELTGKKKTMFFGTSTTVGLKLAFDGSGVPESISLGYKRKEISVIPLGTRTGQDDHGKDIEIDTYPSVIASIDMRVRSASLDDTSLALSQFFATGYAAESLAYGNPEIRSSFQTIAENATNSRAAVFVSDDAVQARKVQINRYVRALVDSGDKATLDAITTKLGLPADPDIRVERRKVISEMDARVMDKDSMDQLSALLRPITQRDF